MTTPPAVFGRFGQTLAVAEQTMTAVLREHLAQRDITPETWYAVKLIGTRGPRVAREALIQAFERSRNLDSDSVGALIARLEVEGLIQGEADVEFTSKGDSLYRSLREYVTAPTIRLLGQFDIHDIETTVRTLEAITQRVEQEG
jgi:DNA-binding MarR family transcriptional regulator